MTRFNSSRTVAALAAVGFFATAGLHSTGFNSITEIASAGPIELRAVVPALWLSFSFDLVVVGLIVAAIACRPTRVGRLLLIIAALCPIAAAGLQLRFIGFVPPTAILLGVACVTLTAAALLGADPKAPTT